MKPRTAKSMGYSVRNLKYIAKFAETYPDCEFVQQVVAQIPWGHKVVYINGRFCIFGESVSSERGWR